MAENDKSEVTGELPPEVQRYLALWEKDPRSRVFAPLAEAFRNIGRVDRAIEMCQHGLKVHPHYVSGRVALGRAYFDKGDLQAAKAQLEMVYEADPENLVAAKTLGEIYEAEGEIEKALLCYRLAHYSTPSATEIAKKIEALQGNIKSGFLSGAGTAPKKVGLSPLEAARKALRESEAVAAGYVTEEAEDEEGSEDDFRAEFERLRRVQKRLLLEKDELERATDLFFNEASLSGTQQDPDAGSKGDLVAQSVTELMLRQGYTQRAVKVYEEFLMSDPDNEQARERIRELNRQLKEIQLEIEIRSGEEKESEREEAVDHEYLTSLASWLNKVRQGV